MKQNDVVSHTNIFACVNNAQFTDMLPDTPVPFQAEFLSFTKNVFVADEMVALSIASQREGGGLVGSTVSISCVAEGVPRPNIDWYTGGSKVVEGVFPRSKPGFTIRYVNTLIIWV